MSTILSYSALVAVINTKFPDIGELMLDRLILQFKRSYLRNQKSICVGTVMFIGHLVNQQVVRRTDLSICYHFILNTVLTHNFTSSSTSVS